MRPRLRLPTAAALVGLLAACSGTPSSAPSTTAGPATSEPTASVTSPAPTSEAPASPTPSPTASVPDPDVAASSADELADRLVAAERAIRDPDTADLATWAQVQHAAYRTLATTPDWREDVLAAVPAELQEPVLANLEAQEQLFALTEPRPELPDWRIVAPAPADELLDAYHAAADEFGIDWTYLASINLVETRMGRIRGLSSAGAQGPMQFIPATWDAYGEGDVNDPQDAIRAAARYLADHGAPQDMDGAIWAYNHSDRYVAAVRAYAAVMQAEPDTYDAYYHWRVHYRLQSGDVVLEEGWTK